MRKFLMHISMALAGLFFTSGVMAQSKEFDNVMEVSLQSTATIKNNNTIVGYALFYKVDKLKKAALYRLEILDENLKSIGSNEFEGSKELYLLNAVYESDHIMLAFFDPKKKDGYEKFVKVFDLKGKETGTIAYEPEKVKKGMFGASLAAQTEHMYGGGYNNVETKGFACVYQSQAKTGGVDIQMISKEGKKKWEKNMTAEKGDRMDMYLIATTPNALIFFCGMRDGIMAKDSKNYLLGLDAENGRELYRKPLDIGELAWEPMLFKSDDNGNLKMISSLSHESDKFYTAQPIGFNIADVNDKTGEIKLVKNFLFEKDLSKVLNMKNESKSEEGYMKIHNICLMGDGTTVIVGEFFRRTVSALGIASKLLNRGGGGPASQISIGDMFLLRLDKQNNAVALEKIEKGIDRVPVLQDGLPLGLTERWLTYQKSFGYEYTDENASAHTKTVLASGKFEGDKYSTSAITFGEGKGYKIKKFNLDKEGKTKVTLEPAKPGHVMLMKYNSKEKKISLSLERVD